MMNHTKTILVTGAGGGMGRAICTMLANLGYTVYGLDNREFTDENPLIHPMVCDVTNAESVTAVKEAIEKETKHLDGIVHTAGIYDLDSLVEIDEARFMRIFEVNLFGVYRINKAFISMLESGSRIVITTSELAPLDPLPFTGIYAVTKAALEKYAYSLRMEVNLLGISVSVIRPGAVNTGLLPASTNALNRFCENTKLYSYNAARFKHIVDSVEARSVLPEKIAEKVKKVLTSKRPKLIYNINRNPLLKLLNILPHRMQIWIIKEILKTK